MRVAAELYTKLGWVIHPISPPEPGNKHTGKAPFEKTWSARTATRTPEELDKFFLGTKNNIGLLCGKPSGVTVLDIDDDVFLKELTAGMDTSAWVMSARTEEIHRGHIFFKYDPGLKSQKHHTIGLEVLSDGNNCVLPPSIHYSGTEYRWRTEDIKELPEIPPEFKKRLLALFEAEKNLKSLLGHCRPCFKKFMENSEKLHGGDGRRFMVALATELCAAAEPTKLSQAERDQAVRVAARLIYREDYDQARTDKEISGIDPARPWRCATLQQNFSEFCKCEDCKFKQNPDPLTNPEKRKGKEFTDFIGVAQTLQANIPILYDKSGAYWIWTDAGYKQTDETDILILFKNVIGFKGVTNSKIKNELLEAVRITGRERQVEPRNPAWIQFLDTVIDLNTGQTFTATPEYFFTNPVPHTLGASEETPIIDKLLEEWVGDRYKRQLYEILSYALLDAYPLHRIIGLHGSGRNGKGQFMKLLKRFIGIENVTSTELERLEESRFETAKLFQKKACFMGETNFNAISNTNRIKQLTGGDVVTGEWKRKAPFDFVNTAKIIIATNSLPITYDRTDGFYSRWLIVDFPNRFTEGRDLIDPIPAQEFQNLGRKCLRILKELLEAGTFTDEGTIEDRARAYEEKSNPVAAFVRTQCETAPAASASLVELFESYDSYQNKNGYRQISKRQFSLQLQEMGYEREKITVGQYNSYYFTGIRLRKYSAAHEGQQGQQQISTLQPGPQEAPRSHGEARQEDRSTGPEQSPGPEEMPPESYAADPLLDESIFNAAREYSNGTLEIRNFNRFLNFYFRGRPHTRDYQKIAGRMRVLEKAGWIPPHLQGQRSENQVINNQELKA